MQEQVVFACTVYDMCKQQDCLTPECNEATPNNYLISPALNGTGFPVTISNTSSSSNFTIAPDNVYYLSSDYKYVSVVADSLDTIMTVKSFTPNTSSPGYYNLKIEYRFNYALEFSDSNFNPVPVYIQNTSVNQVQAYSIYTKEVQLYGGETKNKVITLSSSSGQHCSNLPEYNIQATANILKATLCPLQKLCCNPAIDLSQIQLDPKGMYAVCVTIGLFTAISLFRPTRVNVLTGDPIEIPTCDNQPESCEDFNSIPFPYSAFDVIGDTHCK